MLEPHELDLSMSRLGNKRSEPLSQRSTDQAEIMQLCEELKLFYVALTRARRRVIIFDQSASTRIPLFEMLEKRKLARAASIADISQTKMGTEEGTMHSAECIEKGMELFKIGVFEEAKKCFSNAGDQKWEFKATAHIIESEAVELRRQLDTRQAGGNGRAGAKDLEAERAHRKLLFDAAYCYVAAGEELSAHRCFLEAGETEYSKRIVSAHDCMICLEGAEGCDMYSSCGHAFHRKCLCDWMESKSEREARTCPYCRGKLTLEQEAEIV